MQRLYTEEGRSVPSVPWNRYPRPQMQRERWLCLNGIWDFSVFDDSAEPVRRGTIRVPFCPESLLSGIMNPPQTGMKLQYSRKFSIPEDWEGCRVLLHFGAVSRFCRVFVNGRFTASHGQAYLPFTTDITEYLKKNENELCVEVTNDLSPCYPWGKQCKKRGGMWYTPVSGIWQTVWLEPVPETYIRSLTIETDGCAVEVLLEDVEEGTVLFEEREIPIHAGHARFEVYSPVMWSPDNPHLYWFEVLCGQDRIKSYFALRTLSTEVFGGVPRLCLNGKPLFFHGLLDQGYWSDGLYTPCGPEAYEKDIVFMKALGFNTLRKHIKIEPEQFYYDCDRLGMVVFQDMVNNGIYHYLRDTVLPTVGLTKIRDNNLNRDPESRRIFLQSMEATVRLLKNHPCIFLWTIFNEGWGQFCADEAYRKLKELDSSRWVDSTSGWFRQKQSDVESLHIYFKKLQLYELKRGKEARRPQLLSEFGGYSFKIPEHSFNLCKTYGYRKYENRENYALGVQALYDEVIPLAEKGLCGAVYTQVSDVEDETNGLFTFDREVLKLQPEELRPWAERLQKAVSVPAEY